MNISDWSRLNSYQDMLDIPHSFIHIQFCIVGLLIRCTLLLLFNIVYTSLLLEINKNLYNNFRNGLQKGMKHNFEYMVRKSHSFT